MSYGRSGGFTGWIGWPIIGIIIVVGSCGFMGLRAIWPVQAGFESALRQNGYPEVEIHKGTTSMGGKSQPQYTARPRVGDCLMLLVQNQFDTSYKLTEVNGVDILDLEGSPTLDESLAHIKSRGIDCKVTPSPTTT